jgi:Predicted acyltransferases
MRGVCVAAVMLFHFIVPFRDNLLNGSAFHSAFYQIANIGWIGVDFFFAISGFVVTMLLTGRTCGSYAAFLRRRSKRLLPAYFMMLAVVTMLAVTVPEKIGVREGFVEFLPWAWLLLGNAAASVNGGALDGGSITVVHVWSLCVEFQFYALWPLLIWSTAGTARISYAILVAVFATIFRMHASMEGVYYNAIYSLTFYRMDAFAYGGIAALCVGCPWSRRWSFPASGVLLIPSIGYLLHSSAWHKADPLVQVIGYGLLGAGAALLILALYVRSAPKFLAARLTSQTIVWLGDRSYSLYLWHLPFQPLVNQLLYYAIPDAGRTLFICSSLTVNIAVSIILAEFSYRFIEARFLASGAKTSPKAEATAFN